MSKQPSFQFYPADWLNDIKLQSCSLEAQGLLINLMCLMHQSDRYGYLLVNGELPPLSLLGKLLGNHRFKIAKNLKLLVQYGVLKKTDDGIYFCERMVKDQQLRDLRKQYGRLGGNPNLVNPIVKDDVNTRLNQKTTPSSSSSSSSSKEKEINKEKESFTCDFFSVSRDEFKKYQKAYPKISLYEELCKMELWLINNPLKRKKNYGRFIVNWLSHIHIQPIIDKQKPEPDPIMNHPYYKPWVAPLFPSKEEIVSKKEIRELIDSISIGKTI